MYIKPDVLEGDNKYHCEQYDRKVSAQRRTYLKNLSNTVVINLKRFEFDYNTMRRLKVNDYCEFPETINFRPWTKEGIAEQEQTLLQEAVPEDQAEGAQMDQGLAMYDVDFPVNERASPGSKQSHHRRYRSSTKENRTNLDLSAEFSDTLVRSEEEQEAASDLKSEGATKAAEQYEYQLTGVLVHSGNADGGHYYSYIKERNPLSPNFGKWFEFNDTHVKDFSLSNLKKECFGGQQQKDDFEENVARQDKMIYERCCNAYLIFYERVDSVQQAQPLKVPRPPIIDTIHSQNQAFKHLKIFSEPDFVSFMLEFISLCQLQDVLYFSESESLSNKLKKQRQLTDHYIESWNDQVKKAQRTAETQELRGLAVTQTEIIFDKDFYQEQINILFS